MTHHQPGGLARWWRCWTGLALVTGLLLWCFDLTDVSLTGTLPDLIYPPLTLGIGCEALAAVRGAGYAGRGARLALLPALLGGLIHLATGVLLLALAPLGPGFAVTELADEHIVQSTASPDGSRIAEVAFRPAGASGGGPGRLAVRVHFSAFPLLEREILVTSEVPGPDLQHYLSWSGNDTLSAAPNHERLDLDLAHARPPDAVVISLRFWHFLDEQQAAQQAARGAAAPLQDLPLYPGSVVEDHSGANSAPQIGAFRAFSVATASSDEAAAWYERALSTAPWTLVQADRRVKRDHAGYPVHVVYVAYHCLQARRALGGGQSRMFYWQMFSYEGMAMVRVIVETPERPGVWYCDAPAVP